MSVSSAFLWALIVAAPPRGLSDAPFAIHVIDEQTGRGVPLVELRTVDHVLYVTDSAGFVAIDGPALADQKVFFHVKSHGYEFPADGFGYRGKALRIVPGGTATLRLKRLNVAQRLYRVTGADIYRDSVLLGRDVPIANPLSNAKVVGSDSVNSAVYGHRVYWFWGDTNLRAYPLGSFHVPGATSLLPANGGLASDRGVNLTYFTRDDGFVADTCRMPGEGPTWIDGVCVLDDGGRQRMFAKYVKVRKFLEVYERGLVEWNDAQKRFEKVATFDFAAPLYPHGHALAHVLNGKKYVYFGNPYPVVRVPADCASLKDPQAYEAFTPLLAGSTAEHPQMDRDRKGVVHWSWKHDAPPVAGRQLAKWLADGLLKDEEAALALRDVDTGETVVAHAGSVAWNEFRQCYVMIAEQLEGTSYLGEIWFAEADAPSGPWVYARKVVTHDKYSFYNPRHHPMFDQDGGRRIFFEGTYSTFFSGNDTPTPRYDYNQIMYSLALDDPRLVLPVAVYETTSRHGQLLATRKKSSAGRSTDGPIAFMALDRPREGAVAVVRRTGEESETELRVRPVRDGDDPAAGEVLFYALPADTASPHKTTVPLYVWRHRTAGQRRYAVAERSPGEEYQRDAKPLCRVWRYPLSRLIKFGD